MFIKTPIFQYFDSKTHILIETSVLDYAIGKVLSQLSTDWVNSDKLNLVNSRAPESNLAKNLSKSDFGQ